MKGIFTLKTYKSGKLIKSQTFKNIVVSDGLDFLYSNILSSGTRSYLKYFKVGTENITPTMDDIDLGNAIEVTTGAGYLKTFDSISYDDELKILLVDFTLDTTEFNDELDPTSDIFIKEVGLFSTDDGSPTEIIKMFNHAIVSDVVKNNLLKYVGRWQFTL